MSVVTPWLCHVTDLQVRRDDSMPLEVSVPAESVVVDKKAVDKLAEGLLAHYLPDLENSKRALQELTWVLPTCGEQPPWSYCLYCILCRPVYLWGNLQKWQGSGLDEELINMEQACLSSL